MFLWLQNDPASYLTSDSASSVQVMDSPPAPSVLLLLHPSIHQQEGRPHMSLVHFKVSFLFFITSFEVNSDIHISGVKNKKNQPILLVQNEPRLEQWLKHSLLYSRICGETELPMFLMSVKASD